MATGAVRGGMYTPLMLPARTACNKYTFCIIQCTHKALQNIEMVGRRACETCLFKWQHVGFVDLLDAEGQVRHCPAFGSHESDLFQPHSIDTRRWGLKAHFGGSNSLPMRAHPLLAVTCEMPNQCKTEGLLKLSLRSSSESKSFPQLSNDHFVAVPGFVKASMKTNAGKFWHWPPGRRVRGCIVLTCTAIEDSDRFMDMKHRVHC